MTKHTTRILLFAALICCIIVVGCTSSTQTPTPGITATTIESTAPVEEVIMATATVQEGTDTEIELSNSAKLVIREGGIDIGRTVQFRLVPQSEWDHSDPQGFIIDAIYEVVTNSWETNLVANLLIPMSLEGMAVEEIEQYQLAYYEDGQWIGIPSSVNSEGGYVTGTINHFCLIGLIQRIGNQPPSVVISTTPSIYANVEYPLINGKYYANVDPLKIDIYVSDPENDRVKVYTQFALDTIADEYIRDLAGWANVYGNVLLSDTFWISYELGPAPAYFSLAVRDGLKQSAGSYPILTPWVEIPEIEPGHYQPGFDIGALPLDDVINRIHVFVRVEDSVKDQPVDLKVTVPVTTLDVPDAVHLLSPGPNVDVICPPDPTFTWDWPNSSYLVNSYRFRLVKGNDLWGSWFPEADWIRSSSDTGFFDDHWTIQEPLSSGSYSWGIVVSTRKNERSFTDDHSIRSEVFKFRVDRSLTGTECFINQQGTLTPIQTLTPTPSPTPTATPSPTPTITSTPRPPQPPRPVITNTPRPAITISPTPGDVYVTLDTGYHCRSGPGQVYDIVWDINAGERFRIIGTDGDGWWLIEVNDPRTSVKSCWLGGGIVEGDPALIPTVPVPPTPTPNALVSYLSPVTVDGVEVTLSLMDAANVDGDIIQLTVNGQNIWPSFTLTGFYVSADVTLNHGLNTVRITALNTGTDYPNTVRIMVSNVVQGSSIQEFELETGHIVSLSITAP